MSEDGRLTQAEHDAMQAANVAWNKQALDSEAEKSSPPDSRYPEAWTLDELDDEARSHSSNWTSAVRWHWVDAVAWVATQRDDLMDMNCALRNFVERQHLGPEQPEARCRLNLRCCADRAHDGPDDAGN